MHAAGLHRQFRADGLRHRRGLRRARRTTSATSISRANTACRSRRVVAPTATRRRRRSIGDEAYTGPGTLVNSHFLDGMDVEDAKRAVIARAEAEGWGEGTTVFRLRDWGVSRQRYWGTPIPIIHCDACGAVPVPRDQLPVVLPEDVDFDIPGNPLDRHPTWKHVACPSLRRRGGARDRHARHVRRFVLVFHPLRQPARATSRSTARSPRRGCRSTQYIGGVEHAILHLLYARFWTRALAQIGMHRRRRAVRRPVHAGHGDARDLSQSTPTAQLAVARRGRAARRRMVEIATGAAGRGRPRREDVEVEEEHRRSRADRRPIWRRRGALVHAVRLAARARPAVVRGRDRGRVALRPAAVAAGRADATTAATATTSRSTASCTRRSPASPPISRRCSSTRRWRKLYELVNAIEKAPRRRPAAPPRSTRWSGWSRRWCRISPRRPGRARGRRRADRRRRLARGRPRAAGRGRGDDRDPGQRQAARHASTRAKGAPREAVEALALARDKVVARPRRQAAAQGDRRARPPGEPRRMKPARPRASLAAARAVAAAACSRSIRAAAAASPAHGLRDIEVGADPGQAGWLIRNALDDAAGRAGERAALPARGRARRPDPRLRRPRRQTVTRERRTLRARYQLVESRTARSCSTRPRRADAGIDVVSSEYADVAAENTALERLSSDVADQIVIRLARFAHDGEMAADPVKGDARALRAARPGGPPLPALRPRQVGVGRSGARASRRRCPDDRRRARRSPRRRSTPTPPRSLAAASAIPMFGGARSIRVDDAGEEVLPAVAQLLDAGDRTNPVVDRRRGAQEGIEARRARSRRAPIALAVVSYLPDAAATARVDRRDRRRTRPAPRRATPRAALAAGERRRPRDRPAGDRQAGAVRRRAAPTRRATADSATRRRDRRRCRRRRPRRARSTASSAAAPADAGRQLVELRRRHRARHHPAARRHAPAVAAARPARRGRRRRERGARGRRGAPAGVLRRTARRSSAPARAVADAGDPRRPRAPARRRTRGQAQRLGGRCRRRSAAAQPRGAQPARELARRAASTCAASSSAAQQVELVERREGDRQRPRRRRRHASAHRHAERIAEPALERGEVGIAAPPPPRAGRAPAALARQRLGLPHRQPLGDDALGQRDRVGAPSSAPGRGPCERAADHQCRALPAEGRAVATGWRHGCAPCRRSSPAPPGYGRSRPSAADRPRPPRSG